MELGRLEYLQALVTEFQATESAGTAAAAAPQPRAELPRAHRRFSVAEAKEQVLANLANFAYDPRNYEHLRQLQVLDLFLDMLSESSDTLVEFAIGEEQGQQHPKGPTGQGTPGVMLGFGVHFPPEGQRRG